MYDLLVKNICYFQVVYCKIPDMTSCFYRDGRVEERGGDGVLQPAGGQRARAEQGVPEGGGPAPQLFRNRAGQVNRK